MIVGRWVKENELVECLFFSWPETIAGLSQSYAGIQLTVIHREISEPV